jgi:hypothetical protein
MELELFALISNLSKSSKGVLSNFKNMRGQQAIVYQRLERMENELDGHEFIASDRTALVAIDFGGRLADLQIAPSLTSFDPLAGDGLKVCKRQSMTPSPCATMNSRALARPGQGA